MNYQKNRRNSISWFQAVTVHISSSVEASNKCDTKRNKKDSGCQQGKRNRWCGQSTKMLQEESRMLKAAKTLNCKRFENPVVHDKDGKYISNPEEVYKVKNTLQISFL